MTQVFKTVVISGLCDALCTMQNVHTVKTIMGMIDDISYVKRYPVYFGYEHSSIHCRLSLIKVSGIDTADTLSPRGCELFNPNTFMTFMWQLLPSSAIPVHAD